MSTHYRGGAAERRALDVYTRLMRSAKSVGTRLARQLREQGLTETQFGCLEMLFHLGPLHPQEITEKHFMTGGNTTFVVTTLEKEGLLKREPDPNDGRATLVRLTAKGRRLVAELLPGHVAAIVCEFSILSAAEQEELGRLCRIVGTRERPPAR